MADGAAGNAWALTAVSASAPPNTNDKTSLLIREPLQNDPDRFRVFIL